MALPARCSLLDVLQGRVGCAVKRAGGGRARPDVPAQEEGIENSVELFPVGLPRREEMLEGGAQQSGSFREAGGHQRCRVLALGEADRESVIAERAKKRSEVSRDIAGNIVQFFERRGLA